MVLEEASDVKRAKAHVLKTEMECVHVPISVFKESPSYCTNNLKQITL